MQFDGIFEMLALVFAAEVFVLNPLQAVARYLPTSLLHSDNLRKRPSQSRCDAENRHRNIVRREQSVKAPKARARAVFIDRLHVPMALTFPRCRSDNLRQKSL